MPSLVGSEMCIRDRPAPADADQLSRNERGLAGQHRRGGSAERRGEDERSGPGMPGPGPSPAASRASVRPSGRVVRVPPARLAVHGCHGRSRRWRVP